MSQEVRMEIAARKDFIIVRTDEIEIPIGLEFEGAVIRAFNIAKRLKDEEEEVICSIKG